MLWTKDLPGGRGRFDLFDEGERLHYREGESAVPVSSDWITNSYATWTRVGHIIRQVEPDEIDEFLRAGSTIAASTIFPANRIGDLPTINQARGTNASIGDRFDLTLACIRRHYRGEASPLRDTLARYAGFFELFGGFGGYTDFFLLDDLLTPDGRIRYFLPFDDFATSPLPTTVAEYRAYRENNLVFLEARRERIADYWRPTGRLG